MYNIQVLRMNVRVDVLYCGCVNVYWINAPQWCAWRRKKKYIYIYIYKNPTVLNPQTAAMQPLPAVSRLPPSSSWQLKIKWIHFPRMTDFVDRCWPNFVTAERDPLIGPPPQARESRIFLFFFCVSRYKSAFYAFDFLLMIFYVCTTLFDRINLTAWFV